MGLRGGGVSSTPTIDFTRYQISNSVGNPMAYEHYKDDEETKRLLQEFLLEQTGKQIRIEFKALDNGGENADNYPDLRPLDGFEGFDKINMDIETED